MAHSCPICDCTCYCGGDIDDILLPDSAAEYRCTCCAEGDPDDWGDVIDDYA